jgi:hypothetical protein
MVMYNVIQTHKPDLCTILGPLSDQTFWNVVQDNVS